MSEKIGLSLSFCVREIAEGAVALKDVVKITTGTVCVTDEDWKKVIATYREVYWANNPDECERIAWILILSGRIDQSRVRGEEAPSICDGYWAA